MFNKIIPHLFLGEFHDYELLRKQCRLFAKPFLFVDARPFFNLLSADPSTEELMVEPLRALSASLAMLVSNDIDVYIYCQAGMERSPFLTALVLFQLGKGSLIECYWQVKSKRPETLIYNIWVSAMEEALDV